ncbi:cyclic nucleotide-binding/CBS domain-containing protein [Candidatus Chloroploca sp. M-50]|uniref:Cyclic nucleotide-binding/CBS domain-containing protein n=1 Tax=Candidatus Chloroploca mongolica TaxID=2528176 RepID=A0ABS4DB49_9CHLR|nr:DUF294 nucleotidyltransferase-like domain-containing protein [Candidatus Chloroploca mongolica]MBP1466673.1 cyclic nucleotide-binding/CBS domain-containing protein [Candidatus Chloroploca mongolica]
MEEITSFLTGYPPFDQLPPQAVARAARGMQIEYFATGQTILEFGGAPAKFLYVVRKGGVDLLRETGSEIEIFDTLGPGEAFGYPSLIRDQAPAVTVRAHTETLAYLLPSELFHRLRDENPAFHRFFAAVAFDRLGFALKVRQDRADPALFQTRLGDLVRRSLMVISPDATVREAAQLMSKEGISCLLVDLPPVGVLDHNTGIITDRDLRNRVLAAGLPADTLVREVMTAPALSLSIDSLAFEGLLLMLERGIHHLPISEQGVVVGMVTNTDILRRQSRSPVFLPRQVDRATGLDELRNYTDQVAMTVSGLLDAGARIADIGRVVAVAHDALHRRLLRDIEMEIGPPPVPYAWIVLGSEGRLEQTLRTDQDNALIYADDAPPEAPAYFRTLAHMMVEQLVACGFPRCPGDVMATNPQWCQPLASWQAMFRRWIDVPEEEALMRSSIFFDYRQLYGDLDAEAGLRSVIARTQGNTIFLARLARAALRATPPLTFFRSVALDDERIDLKTRGTAMVVDLARLFALEAGRSETGTLSRLQASWPTASVSQAAAEGLADAFELLSLLRLRHQHQQITRGEEPTNLVVFPQLSPLERRELKESLQIIARIQRSVAMTYQTSRLG